MIKLIATMFGLFLNGFVVRAYLLGQLGKFGLTLCQLGLGLAFGVMIKRATRKDKGEKSSWLKRWFWVSGASLIMYLYSMLVLTLLTIDGQNQAQLATAQTLVPAHVFYGFIVIASVGEEVLYRHLLWEKLRTPVSQLGLSALLFTLAHSPQGLGDWLIYGGLALMLGVVRLKTDLCGATLCHLTWNTLVFCLSYL